jgi:hypothetical protein
MPEKLYTVIAIKGGSHIEMENIPENRVMEVASAFENKYKGFDVYVAVTKE